MIPAVHMIGAFDAGSRGPGQTDSPDSRSFDSILSEGQSGEDGTPDRAVTADQTGPVASDPDGLGDPDASPDPVLRSDVSAAVDRPSEADPFAMDGSGSQTANVDGRERSGTSAEDAQTASVDGRDLSRALARPSDTTITSGLSMGAGQPTPAVATTSSGQPVRNTSGKMLDPVQSRVSGAGDPALAVPRGTGIKNAPSPAEPGPAFRSAPFTQNATRTSTIEGGTPSPETNTRAAMVGQPWTAMTPTTGGAGTLSGRADAKGPFDLPDGSPVVIRWRGERNSAHAVSTRAEGTGPGWRITGGLSPETYRAVGPAPAPVPAPPAAVDGSAAAPDFARGAIDGVALGRFEHVNGRTQLGQIPRVSTGARAGGPSFVSGGAMPAALQPIGAALSVSEAVVAPGREAARADAADPALPLPPGTLSEMPPRLHGAVSPPAPLPDAARQVAAQLAERGVTAPGSYEITLSPEELGRVRIVLTPGETGVTVVITGERAETLDLLRRHIDHLSQDLRNLGLGNPEFAFGDQARKNSGQSALPTTDSGDADPQRPATTSVHATAPIYSAEGLDLRL